MSELLAQVWHYSQLGLGLFQGAALALGTIYCLIQTIRRPSTPNEWHRTAWKDGAVSTRAFAE
jgi:hypothetical protein